jgi:hypothetical protein
MGEMSAALAFQKATRALLIANPDVLALVPETHILDVIGAPERFPTISIGEAQELQLGEVAGVDRYSTLYGTLHVWSRDGLANTKLIAGAMRNALRGQTWSRDGFQCLDMRFENARFMRDPDGVTAHGVLTIRATIEELPA